MPRNVCGKVVYVLWQLLPFLQVPIPFLVHGTVAR